MRWLTLLMALCLVACDEPPALDKEMDLAFSEQRTIEGALSVTFKEVDEERCPSTVTCGSAGNVFITLDVSKPFHEPATFTLALYPSPSIPEWTDTADYEGYSITLVEVTPYPDDFSYDPEEYVATLLVHRD